MAITAEELRAKILAAPVTHPSLSVAEWAALKASRERDEAGEPTFAHDEVMARVAEKRRQANE